MRFLIIVVLVSGVLLAACGSDDSDTKTVIENKTPTTVTQTETTTTTPTTETTPAASKSYKFFQSPTKNIGCAAVNENVTEVRCDIRTHDFEAPAKPADCELDYGSGVVIEAGGAAEFVCAGDTTLGNGPVLGYGETNKVGSITCKSEQAGMTCMDSETGRGFFLSRQSYRFL